MDDMFKGFYKETMDFLWGIRFNPYKEWFEQHRQEYKTYLSDPMKSLGEQVERALNEKGMVQGENKLSISRIYRDARRLKGRPMYRDRMWFSIRSIYDNWACIPGFYFELSPDDYSYGFGYFFTPPDIMKRFRERIDQKPEEFEGLLDIYEGQNALQLSGEKYKKDISKGKSERVRQWYQTREMVLNCTRPIDELIFMPELANKIVADFEATLPIYRYFYSLH